VPCAGIRSCSASIDGKSRSRDLRKPASRRRGTWGFDSGSCCAIRLTTPSSAVVAWRGRHKGGVHAGMPVLALVLVRE
jgi:hypothetical protein